VTVLEERVDCCHVFGPTEITFSTKSDLPSFINGDSSPPQVQGRKSSTTSIDTLISGGLQS
jgi:hypothetical protein